MFKIQKPLREDPTQKCLYIIGDLLGKNKLNRHLLSEIFIKNIFKMPLAKNDVLIYTGNFFGEESNGREIIREMRALKERCPIEVVFIKGKEDNLLLKFRKNFINTKKGKSFINSYKNSKNKNWIKDLFEDLNWLNSNLSPCFYGDKFFVCSGGVLPNKKIENQNINSLMYYDNSALGNLSKNINKTIIHGTHKTKNNKVEVRKRIINVNTSPNKTNTLGCILVNDTTGKIEEVISYKKDKEK